MQDELARKRTQRDEIIAVIGGLERGRDGGTRAGDLTTRTNKIDDTAGSIDLQKERLARVEAAIAKLEARSDA